MSAFSVLPVSPNEDVWSVVHPYPLLSLMLSLLILILTLTLMPTLMPLLVLFA